MPNFAPLNNYFRNLGTSCTVRAWGHIRRPQGNVNEHMAQSKNRPPRLQSRKDFGSTTEVSFYKLQTPSFEYIVQRSFVIQTCSEICSTCRNFKSRMLIHMLKDVLSSSLQIDPKISTICSQFFMTVSSQ